jgi:hypothetical protein
MTFFVDSVDVVSENFYKNYDVTSELEVAFEAVERSESVEF